MHDIYFYTDISHQDTYSEIYSPHINIQRLLQGQPFFKQFSEVAIKKKKTFILPHKLVHDFTSEQINLLLKKIQLFRTEGFLFYHYFLGDFIPLSDYLTKHQEILGVPDDYDLDKVMLHAIHVLQLTADQLYVFTKENLETFMADTSITFSNEDETSSDETSRHIESDIIDLDTYVNQDDKSHIKHLIFTNPGYSYTAEEFQKIHDTHLPQLKQFIFANTNYYNLTADTLNYYFSTDFDNIQEFYDTHLDTTDFKENQILFKQDQLLQLIINPFQQMETFALLGIEMPDNTLNENTHIDELLKSSPQLPHLKKIILVDSIISSHFLFALLKCAPHIEFIQIYATKIKDDFFPLLEPLSQLKELYMEYVEASDKSCATLSKITPNIQYLTVLNDDESPAPEILNAFTHKKQKKYPCVTTSTNTFFSEGFCINDLDVQELNLMNDCPNTAQVGHLLPQKQSACSLSSVKIFRIANQVLEENDLANVLAFFPNIRHLYIDRCSFKNTIIPNTLSLPNLVSIEIEYSNIPPHALGKLTQLAHPSVTYTIENDIASEAMAEEVNTLYVDANTTFSPDKHLQLERLFWSKDPQKHPQPALYRESIYGEATIQEIPCNIQEAFILTSYAFEKLNITTINPEEIIQSSVDLYDFFHTENKNDTFYSQQYLLVKDKTWIPLVSLSPQEKMTHYHIDIEAPIELGYSPLSNFYYIRLTRPMHDSQLIRIDFIISVPPPDSTQTIENILHSSCPLMFEVAEELKKYQPKASMPVQKQNTGLDYYKSMRKEKVGACRHRTFSFLYERTNLINIYTDLQTMDPDITFPMPPPVRIINNACHSFIEIYHEHNWYPLDLGGYPARIEINDALVPLQPTTDNAVLQPLQKDSLDAALTPSTHYFAEHHAALTIEGLLQSISTSQTSSILIMLENCDDVSNIRHLLQTYWLSNDHLCFNINQIEDLSCHSASLSLSENYTGHTQPGPSGALYTFLTQPTDKSRVILFDLRSIQARDLIRFNGLLDPEPHADGIPLPNHTKVILLMNKHQSNAYQGSDIQSRCSQVITLAHTTFNQPLPPLYHEAHLNAHIDIPSNVYEIELYGGEHWEEILIGRWTLQHQNMVFIPGALLHALRENYTAIHLKNTPIHNIRFDSFWRDALLYGKIDYFGQSIAIPKELQLFTSRGYPQLDMLIKQVFLSIQQHADYPTEALALNAGLLPSFFTDVQFSLENHSICQVPGLLSQYKKSPIKLYLTHSLSLDTWVLFLNECLTHHVTIHLSVASNIHLPSEMNIIQEEYTPVPIQPLTAIPIDQQHCDIYLISNDIDATIASYFREEKIIIDVSELEPQDLFDTFTVMQSADSQQFIFNEKPGYLPTSLREDKRIILKGHFKDTLCHHLMRLLVSRQQHPTTGHLILITEQSNAFPVLKPYQHMVTTEQKKELLDQYKQFTPIRNHTLLSTHSFAQLKTIQRYNSIPLPHDPWIGLENLPSSPEEPCFTFTEAAAEQQARAFEHVRLSQVTKLLEQSPFIFLSGVTGVGKTTFIHTILKKHCQTLFIGSEKMVAWANCQDEGLKILFIDEANLALNQWSQFEGLFNHPPALFLNHQYIELMPTHKVIFAGNPRNYCAGRQTAPFFQRHGNCILFEPMPPAYIYNELLKPIFNNVARASAWNEDTQLQYVQPILKFAAFLNGLHQDKVFINPRALVMIALLALPQVSDNDPTHVSTILSRYINLIGDTLIPDKYRKQFHAEFIPDRPSYIDSHEKIGNIVLNTNNYSSYQALQDMLTLRDYRKKYKSLNTAQLYGGLGGLIIEGEPGLGKSQLVIQMLEKHNITRGDLHTMNTSGNVYYHIPVSLSPSDKNRLLIKAFHEGAIVFIDEINCAPMMEDLLNHLLMGRTPEGEPPHQPGFLLIGTQNPISMNGRLDISPAIKSRTLKTIMKPYNKEQMLSILKQKGYPVQQTKEIIEEYFYLRITHPKLDLCFRDVLRIAEKISPLTLPKANSTLFTLFSLHSTSHSITTTQESIGEDRKRLASEAPLEDEFPVKKVCEVS